MTDSNLGTGARTGATLTYDEQLRALVLVGGRVEIDGDEYIHGDMKYWDGAGWMGYGALLLRVLDVGLGRYGLAWHAAAYDSHRKQLVLYKGLLGCAHNNEGDQKCPADANDEIDNSFVVWFSGNQGRIWPMRSDQIPRQQAKMVYDTDRQRFVAFGGFALIGPADTMVIEDGGRFMEMRPNPSTENDPYQSFTSFAPGSNPGRRLRHSMVYDRNRKRVVLYGGGLDIHRFNDTWELVAYAPVVTQQPAAIYTRCAGEALQIPVTMQGFAVGMDEHSFQWYKDGAPVPGATSNILSISTITTAQAGNYQAFIVNRCGVQTNTTVARVVVHDKPTILAFDATRKDRCPGDSVVFSVSATSTLPIRYQWFKNGAPIAGAEQSLSLSNLKHEDTGDYHVTVSNDCGTTSSERAHLQVGVTILDQPDDTVGPVCGWAGFFLAADGVGTLRYQWRLDGAPVRNDVYFAGATSPGLSIQPLLYGA